MLATVRKSQGTLLELANRTSLVGGRTILARFQAVSESGGLMPQKSTYFYPKLATGITLNPLT